MVEETGDDPKGCFAASHAINDLAKMEGIQVITSEDVMKLVASKK